MMIAWALVAATGHAVFGETPSGSLKKAQALFKEGRFSDAEKAYHQVLVDDSNNGQSILRLGEIALLGNRFTDAEEQLARAITLLPDDRRAKSLLAECYYRQDKFNQAASIYRDLGRAAIADQLDSFSGLIPYEISGNADVTHVKFTQTDPLPIVKARINDGEEIYLLIDTGGGELILDKGYAEAIGVRLFGPPDTGLFAGGKTALIHHGTIESIQLGDFKIKNVPVAVKKGRMLPMNVRIDGVLGTVLLYHFLSTLDYPNGELVLQRRTPQELTALDKAIAARRTYTVPFWMADRHWLVAWGKINQIASCLMHIDTGMGGGGFDCHESVRKAAGIDLTGLPTVEGMGGGGPVTITPFEVQEVALGDARRFNVRGLFGGMPPQMEYAKGFRIGAIVSHGFFRSYTVTFDFQRMKMHLTPGRG